LDLDNDLASVLQFSISPSDIGGTLAVEMGVNAAKVIALSSIKYSLKSQIVAILINTTLTLSTLLKTSKN